MLASYVLNCCWHCLKVQKWNSDLRTTYFITAKRGCPPRNDDVLLGTLADVARQSVAHRAGSLFSWKAAVQVKTGVDVRCWVHLKQNNTWRTLTESVFASNGIVSNFFCLVSKMDKLKFSVSSNPRPSVCMANVLTARPWSYTSRGISPVNGSVWRDFPASDGT